MENLPEDMNLQYLTAEIRQMDARVRYALNLRLKTGQEEVDRFRGLYISPQEAQELAASAGGSPVGMGEEAGEYLREAQAAAAESRQLELTAQQCGIKLRLLNLKEFFGLSDFEYHAFLVCLLPAIDLRYERIYGFLQDDVTKKQAGVDLIFSLWNERPSLEVGRLKGLVSFSAKGTLVRYHLLRALHSQGDWQEPRLNQIFEVSPALVSWLMGQYFPEETWLHLTLWEQLQSELEGNLFASQFTLEWEKIIRNRPLLAFDGPDDERQHTAACKVASQFNMPLLRVDLREIPGEDMLKLSMLRLIIRDACLLETIVYLQGWERVLDSNGFVPAEILEEMAVFGGIFVLGSRSSWRITEKVKRPVFHVLFERPSSEERAHLWKHALQPDTTMSADVLRDLAGQFTLTSGQIDNAVFAVKNSALQNGAPFSTDELFMAARQQSAHHLSELAQKIEPRYTWENIVLPPEELGTLNDIVSMMRYRSLVLEKWGLGERLTSSKGISALFAGDPGTGKTLAAQVVAASLQLDLYRIDLSRVVSKYIGETEKNLDQIFEEAENSNAILFFDEADAIFGKRSEVKDAHDRYANIEVGYLLQRMETYDGVTILATNLRTNMDDAFTRRLNFIVNFPLPGEEQRLKIWKVLLPPGLPVDGEIDWAFLAHHYPIPGGNIRNILVSAAFLAARRNKIMDMDNLLEATRQEMQKMGRFIKEEDYIYLSGASA